MWQEKQRYYLLAEHEFMSDIERLIGAGNFTVVQESGGKFLLTNLPLTRSRSFDNADSFTPHLVPDR